MTSPAYDSGVHAGRAGAYLYGAPYDALPPWPALDRADYEAGWSAGLAERREHYDAPPAFTPGDWVTLKGLPCAPVYRIRAVLAPSEHGFHEYRDWALDVGPVLWPARLTVHA